MDKVLKANLTNLKKLAIEYNLKVFIVFGSRIDNTSNKLSDYDFAYFSNSPLKNKKFELWSKLELIFKKVDLIELNTTPSIILRNEIFEKGYCIYEDKEGLFEDLAGDAWIDYIDNLDYFKKHKNMLKEAIKEL